MSNLGLRIITGAILGILILGSVLAGPWIQGIVFSAFMIVGLLEFYRMCDRLSFIHVSKEMGVFIGIFIYVLLLGMSIELLPIISITVIFPLFLV